MTLAKYTAGFIVSLVLTIVAYSIVMYGNMSGIGLLALLGVLAIVQMIVQLIFFLHLGDEAGPRYKLWTFLAMAVTLIIIVVGSLWIIQNMNYNMQNMSADQKTQYMLMQHDKGF